MPRYFFNLRNDLDVDDHEGVVFPDLGEARLRGAAYAKNMAAVSVTEHGRINLSHHIDIADETGQVLSTVRFGDVVKITG